MKIATISLMVLAVVGGGLFAYMDRGQAFAPGGPGQQPAEESVDAEELYDLVQLARAELRRMRVAAGLSPSATGRQSARLENHEGGEFVGEHGAPADVGEDGEHGGEEHGGGAEGDEDGSAYLPKAAEQNSVFANGARLELHFDPRTQVFVGSVANTTARTLPQVRVEVHLDNGTELGPTRRIDLAPGQTAAIELGAFGNEFSSWASHPEAGAGEGHLRGGDEGGEGARPRGAAYRPLYNQVQILRGEMHAFALDLGAGRGNGTVVGTHE